MREQKQHRETPQVAWLVLGNLVAYAICYAVKDEFDELAKTEDWVLEYSTWIRSGVYVVYFLIVVGFLLFGKRKNLSKDTKSAWWNLLEK
jgi:hypothetical protein